MPEPEPLERVDIAEREEKMLEKMADWIVRKRMTTPAILFLESVRPMNFIGSQVVVFFQPFLTVLFDPTGIETFQSTMEKRESIERLLILIEQKDRDAQDRERAEKAARKEARRQRRAEKRAARIAKREA